MPIYIIENEAFETKESAIKAMENLTIKRSDIYDCPSSDAWEEAKNEGWNPYEYFNRIDSVSLEQLNFN